MTDQLALVDVQPAQKLTARQQAVLDAVRAAGIDGLDADHAGAILHEQKGGRWAHTRDERCEFCARTGNEVLRALRSKGLVRYRRAKGQLPAGWITTAKPERVMPPGYNEFPEGF